MRRCSKVGVWAVALALAGNVGVAFARGPLRTVRYHGYRVAIPASWPVFDLATEPSTCVRFDRHALYLGTPGGTERCPAHAVGRTEAILVEPLMAGAARSSPGTASIARGLSLGRSGASFPIPSVGVVVTATWSRDPAVVVRAVDRRSLRSSSSRQTSGVAALDAGAAGARAHAAAAVYGGLGFDVCSAPSTGDMSAWLSSPYRAVGIYIGGTNSACAQPNLTANWVKREVAAGWHLIPTYVGLQAPGACGCSPIMPQQAAAEGAAAATDAISHAQALGIPAGNPIYFDMEGYSPGGATTASVLTFLSAWTSQLHSNGYTSGVYSGGASGIADLAGAFGTGFLEPDDLWIADWNGERTTRDPYVPNGDWPTHQRLHQYEGGHSETYGGVTLDIDDNYLDGATADTSGSLPNGTFVQVPGSPAIYRIAGGAPLYVSTWDAFGGPQPYTVISQRQFETLAPVPANGTLISDAATGEDWIVVGGAPLAVSSCAAIDTCSGAVDVDPNDVLELNHLNPVPANGTFIRARATGTIWRVAGGAPFVISNCQYVNGCPGFVDVDPNAVSQFDHLNRVPADGTIVEGLPSDSYWSFSSGYRAPTGASPTAVGVDDAGLAAFPTIPGFHPQTVRCTVPRLARMTLSQATRALRRAHCRLGKVRKPNRVPRHHVLRVTNQSAPPRSAHRVNYAVNVTLR